MAASSFAHMSARDRLQLKVGGKSSMEAYPGVERILNTLHERLQGKDKASCAAIALVSVNSIGTYNTGTTLESILFGLAIFQALFR